MVDDVAELLCWIYVHHPSVLVTQLDGCGTSVPEATPGAGGQAHRYARPDAPAERTARAAGGRRWDARSSFPGHSVEQTVGAGAASGCGEYHTRCERTSMGERERRQDVL